MEVRDRRPLLLDGMGEHGERGGGGWCVKRAIGLVNNKGERGAGTSSGPLAQVQTPSCPGVLTVEIEMWRWREMRHPVTIESQGTSLLQLQGCHQISVVDYEMY